MTALELKIEMLRFGARQAEVRRATRLSSTLVSFVARGIRRNARIEVEIARRIGRRPDEVFPLATEPAPAPAPREAVATVAAA